MWQCGEPTEALQHRRQQSTKSLAETETAKEKQKEAAQEREGNSWTSSADLLQILFLAVR